MTKKNHHHNHQITRSRYVCCVEPHFTEWRQTLVIFPHKCNYASPLTKNIFLQLSLFLFSLLYQKFLSFYLQSDFEVCSKVFIPFWTEIFYNKTLCPQSCMFTYKHWFIEQPVETAVKCLLWCSKEHFQVWENDLMCWDNLCLRSIDLH